MLCVSQATLSVSSCVCFVAGALRRIHAEALLPPDPKGWISAVATPATLSDLLGAPCRESPGLSILSLAFLGVQLTVGCQSTRATPRIAPRRPKLPQARLPALLNVSAADESTTAGSLKALSKLRWSQEV